MIISNNFIFVHIPKTGGKSITEALRDTGRVLYFVHSYSTSRGENKYNHHMRLRDLGLSSVEKFKFCFVRNPWAHRVSFYSYVKQKYPDSFSNMDFEHYVRDFHSKPISYFLADKYDKIYEREKFSEALVDIGHRIGNNLKEYHHNVSQHTNYQDYYKDNQNLIDFIAKEEEFLLSKFPYKFEKECLP